jgi:hypothetical protein
LGSQKFWHRPNLREWWVGEKIIGKAITNALPPSMMLRGAKETTMAEGWRGLQNFNFGTLSREGKCGVVMMSGCQKIFCVQDRPT